MSAEHGIGLAELREALAPFTDDDDEDDDQDTDQSETDEDVAAEDDVKPLRLAIVGRPNVGKSSLLNRLIGEERALTSPEAGTTRDAVLAEWRWGEREIVLHDTAGLRKKARVSEKLEQMSTRATLHAVRFADCVILVMDAREALEKQDLIIADLIAREGRAIVLAMNKWDEIKDRQAAFKELREKTDRLLPQIAGAQIVGLSALTGEGIERLMPAVVEADRIWNIARLDGGREPVPRGRAVRAMRRPQCGAGASASAT